MNLISVIVPVYKVEDYLDECIASIVNQTHKNLEIILVDDGSPDKCPEICDEWAKKDSRIRVIHQKNAGAAVARNIGLDAAKGDYIGFVDSDDYVLEEMYEQLLMPLESGEAKASCCLFSRVHSDGRIVSDAHKFDRCKLMDAKEAVDASLYNVLCNALWCKLFEKSVFDGVRLPVGEINEDIPIMLPTIVNSEKIALVNKELYCYRKREGSVTSGGYFTAKNLGTVQKNLNLIAEQLSAYGLPCKRSYSFFVASNAYSIALVMEKHREKLGDNEKKMLSNYKKLMWKNCLGYIFSRHSLAKDKILYLMVLTKTVRPLYALFNKTK